MYVFQKIAMSTLVENKVGGFVRIGTTGCLVGGGVFSRRFKQGAYLHHHNNNQPLFYLSLSLFLLSISHTLRRKIRKEGLRRVGLTAHPFRIQSYSPRRKGWNGGNRIRISSGSGGRDPLSLSVVIITIFGLIIIVAVQRGGGVK